MRLQRRGDPDGEIPVVRVGERFLDARSITADFDTGFWSGDGLKRLRDAVRFEKLPDLPHAKHLRVGAPIARPTAVICIGQNYAAHAAESGDVPPEQPVIFFKHPNTIVGPFDDILIPPGAQKVDWEVELGVVIGKRARYLESESDALGHVAGLVTSHDVSERDYQLTQSGGQWSKGKSSETFNPLGPELVTLDEISDPQALRLWSRVNGELRQDSSTADMIFSVAHLVHHASQFLVLEPGDVINTGTPQGVALSGRFPYLSAGDIVEIGIDELGAQRSRCEPAPARLPLLDASSHHPA